MASKPPPKPASASSAPSTRSMPTASSRWNSAAATARQILRRRYWRRCRRRCGFNFQTAKTVRYDSAISPRDAPELCLKVPPSSIRGRRECRALDAPAASRVEKNTRVSHHGHAGSPDIPRAMVLTAYFALSPVTGLSCHRRRRNLFHQLDTSVGVSGPHDFAVRKGALSSGAHLTSTASRPASVTIASRPSVGRDEETYAGELGQMGMEIFFAKGGWTAPQISGG